MDSENKVDAPIRGGVIIIGSLFWEDENNCLEDGKGKARRIWRDKNLDLTQKIIIKLPVRYGRSSSTRRCTYTMVLSRECLGKEGQGIIIPYRKDLNFEAAKTLDDQVNQLAIVEGIGDNCKWGAISIWINKKSEDRVRNNWNTVRKSQYGHLDSTDRFNWSDKILINKNYELIDIPIQCELDFLLCTYIKPKHKNLSANKECNYPSEKEIAAEMLSSGYQIYFCQNRASGIRTFQDERIISELRG